MDFNQDNIINVIDNISLIISSCRSDKHRKRFESIFINTSDSINITGEDRQTLEGDGFRYRNLRQQDIKKILELFSNDTKLNIDIITSYTYRIRFILSNFKNKIHLSSRNIPKTWRLSESNKVLYKTYINNS